eukprot:6212759-Pleurochrysis_carterae.AAC.7
METYSQTPFLRSNSKHAPGSWYRARTEALRRYFINHFGILANPSDSTTQGSFALPEPKTWFRLHARPDHSNYLKCQECCDRRLAVERLIAAKAPRAEINAARDKQMAHVKNRSWGATVSFCRCHPMSVLGSETLCRSSHQCCILGQTSAARPSATQYIGY